MISARFFLPYSLYIIERANRTAALTGRLMNKTKRTLGGPEGTYLERSFRGREGMLCLVTSLPLLHTGIIGVSVYIPFE